MTVRRFVLDVAIRDNAGVLDVVAAIEKSVKSAHPGVLAAELQFEQAASRLNRKRDSEKREAR